MAILHSTNPMRLSGADHEPHPKPLSRVALPPKYFVDAAGRIEKAPHKVLSRRLLDHSE